MEAIDLYDRNKNKLNKTFVRGKDRLNNGEYYLLEQVWIVNKNNEILLNKEMIINLLVVFGNLQRDTLKLKRVMFLGL